MNHLERQGRKNVKKMVNMIPEQFEFLPLDTNPTEPKMNLILLHGYGTDGFDLLHLGDLWQQQVRDLAIYALQAPEPCPGAPGGRQWFAIPDMDPHLLYKGTHQASHYLEAALHHAVKHTGVPLEQTILMGFSQGCMMALYTGLYKCPTLAGILGYSGGMYAPAAPEEDAKNMPILLVHGAEDQVVPLAYFEATVEQLKKDGLNPEAHILPGVAHQIEEQGFHLGTHFLQKLVLEGAAR